MVYNDGNVHIDFYDKNSNKEEIAEQFSEGDPELKKVLLELWKNNIKTVACCRGHNDKEMIEYVDLGIAMGNAIDKVKNAANYVTSDIDNDGIYNALKHFNII